MPDSCSGRYPYYRVLAPTWHLRREPALAGWQFDIRIGAPEHLDYDAVILTRVVDTG